jgi:predicted XRE-type DNA-binding protein
MTDIEKLLKTKKINKLRPLPKNASPLETWKFKLSQKISEFKIVRGLSLEDMSILLDSDKANISRIMNGHIEKVTLDKLLHYLEILLIASKNKKLSDKFHSDADNFFKLEDIKFA